MRSIVLFTLALTVVGFASCGAEEEPAPSSGSVSTPSASPSEEEVGSAPSPSPTGDDARVEEADVKVSGSLLKEFDAAISVLDEKTQAFNDAFEVHFDARNLDGVKTDAATVRTAIFVFDDALRQMDWPPELQVQVNELLTANGEAIAILDSIRAAKTLQEAKDLLDQAAQVHDDIISSADKLHDSLET